MFFHWSLESQNCKYNNIWDKVSADIKKEFDNKPVFNTNFLIKIKSYGDAAADFHDKEILKAGSNHIFLAAIMILLLILLLIISEVLLKECKYIEKEKRRLDILLIS